MAEEQEAKPGELRGAASRPAPPRFGSVSCRAAAALIRGKGPERFGVFPSENGSVGIGLDGGVIWPPPHSRGKRFATSVSTICLPCRRSAIDRGRPGKSARRQLLAPSVIAWDAHAISGAEGRPAVPSIGRFQAHNSRSGANEHGRGTKWSAVHYLNHRHEGIRLSGSPADGGARATSPVGSFSFPQRSPNRHVPDPPLRGYDQMPETRLDRRSDRARPRGRQMPSRRAVACRGHFYAS
jgi:hypothetical protein